MNVSTSLVPVILVASVAVGCDASKADYFKGCTVDKTAPSGRVADVRTRCAAHPYRGLRSVTILGVSATGKNRLGTNQHVSLTKSEIYKFSEAFKVASSVPEWAERSAPTPDLMVRTAPLESGPTRVFYISIEHCDQLYGSEAREWLLRDLSGLTNRGKVSLP